MSDLKTFEPSDPAALVKAFSDAPLNAAPADLRMAVGRLWMLTSHLFPTPLPIAAAVGIWVRDDGLAEDDARAILAGMLRPEQMRNFKFASDLMTALAGYAFEAIRRRRSEARQAADRAEGERWRRENLERIGQVPQE